MPLQAEPHSPHDAEQQESPAGQSSRPQRTRSQVAAMQPCPIGAHVPQLVLQQYSPAAQYFPAQATSATPPAPPAVSAPLVPPPGDPAPPPVSPPLPE
jgi:hypothetical protein